MSAASAQKTSLYVGDVPLDLPNPEETLSSLFNSVAPVVSIKVCRDMTTVKMLGYAYVNFQNSTDAEKALDALNYTEIIPGKQIRVMFSVRDPILRKSGLNNVCVKKLDPSINAKALHKFFSVCGRVLSCKVSLDNEGNSRGYGFVQFESNDAAKAALELNGKKLGESEINIMPFVRKAERDAKREKTFTNVYANNIMSSATEEEARKAFEKYGSVSSFFFSGADQHQTKFVLVTFETHASALQAIEDLNGSTEPPLATAEKPLMVCRAFKKSERLRAKKNVQTLYQSQGRNLYVKHLAEDTTKEQLEELFSPYGKITSCALMKDSNSIFRGFAFVCYDNKDSAMAAMRELNDKVIAEGKRPLYVSQAEQKDMRLRLLKQRRVAVTHPKRMPPPMGMHNPQWGPRQFSVMNPIYPPMSMPPSFMQGPCMMQQQSMPPPPPPLPNRYTNWHGQLSPAPMPVNTGIDYNHLSMMSLEERKNALGETLYSRISELAPQRAAKITGMLLEMGTAEILEVLENQNALQAKVNEAITVLRQHGTQ